MIKSTIHELRLHPSPFKKIEAGIKTIEMRLWDEKRRLMNVGDKIIFFKRSEEFESITCTIKMLHFFPSFMVMCETLSLERMGYEGEGLRAWLEHHDHGMSRYYSPDDENRYGVVGIEIQKDFV